LKKEYSNNRSQTQLEHRLSNELHERTETGRVSYTQVTTDARYQDLVLGDTDYTTTHRDAKSIAILLSIETHTAKNFDTLFS